MQQSTICGCDTSHLLISNTGGCVPHTWREHCAAACAHLFQCFAARCVQALEAFGQRWQLQQAATPFHLQLNQAGRQLREALEEWAVAAGELAYSSAAEAARQHLQCIAGLTVELAQCLEWHRQCEQRTARLQFQLLQLWWQGWQLGDVLAADAQAGQVPARREVLSVLNRMQVAAASSDTGF